MKLQNIIELTNYLKTNKVYPTDIELFQKLNTSPILDGITLYELLKRPEIKINNLKDLGKIPNKYDATVLEQVEISIKYAGYIAKEEREASKLKDLESIKIPEDLDYQKIPNLASEGRQKLDQVKPITLGQASRISGVNPADIAVLSVYLKRLNHESR